MNTCVSHFMIATNELRRLQCNKRAVLEPLVVLIAPFGPHLAEELWQSLGHTTSVCDAQWPAYDEECLKTDTKEFPIQINGKLRATIELPSDVSASDAETAALALEQVQKWLDGQNAQKSGLRAGPDDQYRSLNYVQKQKSKWWCCQPTTRR
jgi:Leucyl-tRNA synthetase